MKIIVAVKRVIDYKTAIRVKADGSGVETANVKMSMNPFDEIALEEAIRIKEQGHASEVIVITIGSDACQETLRSALAMGADRAIHVKTDSDMQPLAVATILQVLVKQEAASLILLGKQAIDTDDNQVGQMLAGLLQCAQATYASKIEKDQDTFVVTREIDGGLETVKVTLPAVITADLRLNEPRYISLPNIVKAKQKPIAIVALDSLGINATAHVATLSTSAPVKRKAGIMVENAADLVKRLKDEAQVI